MLQGGALRPLHHSHVGGVFETEDEIVQLLDTLGPDIIGVGPDTGHLQWASVDPAAFTRRYADRIGGIHIKDCFPDYLIPQLGKEWVTKSSPRPSGSGPNRGMA